MNLVSLTPLPFPATRKIYLFKKWNEKHKINIYKQSGSNSSSWYIELYFRNMSWLLLLTKILQNSWLKLRMKKTSKMGTRNEMKKILSVTASSPSETSWRKTWFLPLPFSSYCVSPSLLLVWRWWEVNVVFSQCLAPGLLFQSSSGPNSDHLQTSPAAEKLQDKIYRKRFPALQWFPALSG